MSRSSITQASRLTARILQRAMLPRTTPRIITAARWVRPTASPPAASQAAPFFSTSSSRTKGIMPDTENPGKGTPGVDAKYTPVEITENDFHELADEYLERILTKCEEIQEEREDFDVEYSAGVMSITVPDKGTYVLNKQPPNKQIWLSSPISGPKRYDWCLSGETQGDKEGTASGSWVYSRDGAKLDDLLLEELEIDLGPPSLEG